MNERFLLHIAFNDGTEIIDACLSTIGIKCGREYRIFTAVDIDGQVHGTALKVGDGEHIGNGRSEAIALGIIIVLHKRSETK